MTYVETLLTRIIINSRCNCYCMSVYIQSVSSLTFKICKLSRVLSELDIRLDFRLNILISLQNLHHNVTASAWKAHCIYWPRDVVTFMVIIQQVGVFGTQKIRVTYQNREISCRRISRKKNTRFIFRRRWKLSDKITKQQHTIPIFTNVEISYTIKNNYYNNTHN